MRQALRGLSDYADAMPRYAQLEAFRDELLENPRTFRASIIGTFTEDIELASDMPDMLVYLDLAKDYCIAAWWLLVAPTAQSRIRTFARRPFWFEDPRGELCRGYV